MAGRLGLNRKTLTKSTNAKFGQSETNQTRIVHKMNPEFRNYLLSVTDSTDCEEVAIIQSLWSGYGKISRYRLHDSSVATVVVKHIDLSKATNHPRGWNTDVGHQRKVRSYEVETFWYQQWNHRCNKACRTARFIGSLTQVAEHWIVLEDLDAQLPVRKQYVNLSEVKTCLRWLAHFHGTFINEDPSGLWPIGTYWHLDTRPEEFAKIEDQQLKGKAHQIDEILNTCKYKTIVHGDAKLANFCFSESGMEVAAVDFQYVGGGCGMKDVAYFLGSCLTENECETHTSDLLDFYFSELQIVIEFRNLVFDYKALEKEWRILYPVAWTDFTRFLLGWMPSHQKVNGYSLKVMQEVLSGLR